MSNIYKNAIDIYKQDADHYRNKYIDALHTISLRNEEIEGLNAECWCGCNNDLKVEYNNMKAEIKSLKADIRHDAKVCDDYDDDLIKECKELQADNDRLKEDLKHKAHKVNTKHYPKEYVQEANEYFEHNDKCTKLLFFMIDSNEFEWDEDNDGMNGMNGEFSGTLYADDCIAEIDNT